MQGNLPFLRGKSTGLSSCKLGKVAGKKIKQRPQNTNAKTRRENKSNLPMELALDPKHLLTPKWNCLQDSYVSLGQTIEPVQKTKVNKVKKLYSSCCILCDPEKNQRLAMNNTLQGTITYYNMIFLFHRWDM